MGVDLAPEEPDMGLMHWVRTAMVDAFPPTPDLPPHGGASPVVPPDSPVLQILVRQAELDDAQAMQQRVRAFSGQASVVDLIVGQAERDRRRAVAAKVRRGQPVTQREVIDATMGLANTMGASGDALRLALAFTPPAASIAPATSPAPRAPTPECRAYDQPAMRATLSGWLRARPNMLLAELHQAPSLCDPSLRTDPWYEVVAICWARTALGEGTVTREALPAAIDAWLRADRVSRQPGSPAPADLRERAWEVDLLTAASDRTARHAAVA